MRLTIITLTGWLMLSLGACQQDEIKNPENNNNNQEVSDTTVHTPPISSAGVKEMSRANQAFGLDLFKQLNKDKSPDNNIVISPVSIQTALNMTANGARGSSQKELLQEMRSEGLDLPDLNEKQRNWRHELMDNSGHPTVKEANALFMDPDRLQTKRKFEKQLQTFYEADKKTLDFNNANAAKDEINNWVDQQTNGKIDEIIKRISPNDLAFIVNALYFQADWQRPFASERTKDQSFNYADGSTKQIPFMSRDGVHSVHTTSDYIALDKAFKEETYSFTLIKPKKTDVQSFIEQLNPEWLQNLYGKMSSGRAIVNMPKMKLEFNEKLNKSLKNIGIQQIFDRGKADLSGMGQSRIGGKVFISRVRHGSVLEVDEKGVEGAAVTSVGASATSAPPVLTFDEPFVLILRHKATNSILFIGRVMKPNWN